MARKFGRINHYPLGSNVRSYHPPLFPKPRLIHPFVHGRVCVCVCVCVILLSFYSTPRARHDTSSVVASSAVLSPILSLDLVFIIHTPLPLERRTSRYTPSSKWSAARQHRRRLESLVFCRIMSFIAVVVVVVFGVVVVLGAHAIFVRESVDGKRYESAHEERLRFCKVWVYIV